MKFLVVKCHAGLGNRIRALVSGQRVARMLGRQLAVQWVIDSYHCGCDFGAIFNTTHFLCGDVAATDLYSIKKESNFISQTDLDVIHVTEENFFWHEEDRGCGTIWGQVNPFEMQDFALRDELLIEFQKLIPSDFVVGSVERFHDEFMKGKSVAALHVRREDNEWSNKYCRDELFVQPIEAFLTRNPNPRILLCTDGEESRKFFKRRFGPLIIEYPVRSLDRGGNYRAVQDAFITMQLMSKSKRIIRSVSSTFSQCAAWIGNIPTDNVGRQQHQS